MSDISHLETEIHELRQEVDELRKKLKKSHAIDAWLKLGGALIAFLTIAVGLYQFVSTTQNGFRKAVWVEQYSLYQKACSAAAEIAVAQKIEDAEESRKNFLHLYWGNLSILEHPNVKDAMEIYRDQLEEVQVGKAETRSLRQLSYRLARECRKSLQKTWNPVDIGDLSEHEK